MADQIQEARDRGTKIIQDAYAGKNVGDRIKEWKEKDAPLLAPEEAKMIGGALDRLPANVRGQKAATAAAAIIDPAHTTGKIDPEAAAKWKAENPGKENAAMFDGAAAAALKNGKVYQAGLAKEPKNSRQMPNIPPAVMAEVDKVLGKFAGHGPLLTDEERQGVSLGNKYIGRPDENQHIKPKVNVKTLKPGDLLYEASAGTMDLKNDPTNLDKSFKLELQMVEPTKQNGAPLQGMAPPPNNTIIQR